MLSAESFPACVPHCGQLAGVVGENQRMSAAPTDDVFRNVYVWRRYLGCRVLLAGFISARFRVWSSLPMPKNSVVYSGGGGFTGSEICFRFSEPNSRKNFGEENEFGCFTRRSYTWTMRLRVSLDHLGISNVRRNHGVEIDGGRTDSVHLGNGRGKCQPYLPISQRILARRTKGERVTKRIIFQLRQNFI